MHPFDAASPASQLPIVFSIKMAGGFGRVANVSYSDTSGWTVGWIIRSSSALFCAQTLAAELLSTNHRVLTTTNLCFVALFSHSTTQPVLSMAVSLIRSH